MIPLISIANLLGSNIAQPCLAREISAAALEILSVPGFYRWRYLTVAPIAFASSIHKENDGLPDVLYCAQRTIRCSVVVLPLHRSVSFVVILWFGNEYISHVEL